MIIFSHFAIFFFFFNDTATTEIYTLSLHDALPISDGLCCGNDATSCRAATRLNNDADPDMSQGPVIGKSRKPYRTARAQNDSVNVRTNQSRLRYPLLIICNYLTEHRATQDDSI